MAIELNGVEYRTWRNMRTGGVGIMSDAQRASQPGEFEEVADDAKPALAEMWTDKTTGDVVEVYPAGTPDESWTVAQLDAYEAEHPVENYPASPKADKIAALTADTDDEGSN